LTRQETARDVFNGDYYKLNARQQEALRALVAAQNAALGPVRFYLLQHLATFDHG